MRRRPRPLALRREPASWRSIPSGDTPIHPPCRRDADRPPSLPGAGSRTQAGPHARPALRRLCLLARRSLRGALTARCSPEHTADCRAPWGSGRRFRRTSEAPPGHPVEPESAPDRAGCRPGFPCMKSTRHTAALRRPRHTSDVREQPPAADQTASRACPVNDATRIRLHVPFHPSLAGRAAAPHAPTSAGRKRGFSVPDGVAESRGIRPTDVYNASL